MLLRLSGRAQVVVKDVATIFGIPWIVERFQPRLVIPIRHPAGVVRPMLDHGTPAAEIHRRLVRQPKLVEGHLARFPRLLAVPPDSEAAAASAAAIRLRVLADDLHAAPDARVVRYEDLTADPISQFRELYAWAELDWPGHLDRHLVDSTSTDDHRAHSVVKDATYRANRWRTELDASAISLVHDIVEPLELPWTFEW